MQSTDEGGFSDPYVTLVLIEGGKKTKTRKTTVKTRTLNPSFNENFAFKVDFDKIEEMSLVFIVADYDRVNIKLTKLQKSLHLSKIYTFYKEINSNKRIEVNKIR